MGILIAVLGILIAFFLLVTVIDCHRLAVRSYEISDKKIKKERTVVLLSDLHNKEFGKGNERLLQKIREQDPAFVLLAGDMYTSARYQDNRRCAEFIRRLAEEFPVYYGPGNHEQKTKRCPEYFDNAYEKFQKRISGENVHYLEDRSLLLPEGDIRISGIEIDPLFYQKFQKQDMEKEYLEKRLGTSCREYYEILIAHNPDYFDAYAEWGADLTVSGHVHGGLMRLPLLGGVISPALRLFPKYDGGEYEKGNKKMILSRGLGTHTLPIRIFNPGELVVIRLKNRVQAGSRKEK